MPIAAVPGYLGDKFDDASPGMRFGMYLKIWGVDRRSRETLWTTHDVDHVVRGQQQELREVKVENKRSAIDAACALGPTAAMLDALRERQQTLAEPLLAVGCLATFHAQAIAPFATGLGNEHPTENGFAFLWPYGLPYLPGSGVKGVLRAAARELGWPDYERIALFGSDPPGNSHGNSHGDDGRGLRRGALSFWDVLPRLEGDKLMVDVMTPHQTHYYQPKDEPRDMRDRQDWLKKTAGSTNPHDSGGPNPIYFLTVPPGSRFVFHVACDPARLPPALQAEGRWRARLAAAFEHAFEWLGFGAKTAVGYGAMRPDLQGEADAAKARTDREEAARQRCEAAEREASLAKMTANMRRIEFFKAEFAARAEQLRGGKERPNAAYHDKARKLAKEALDGAGWTAEERRAAAEAIEEWLPKAVQIDMKDERKKLKLASLRGQA